MPSLLCDPARQLPARNHDDHSHKKQHSEHDKGDDVEDVNHGLAPREAMPFVRCCGQTASTSLCEISIGITPPTSEMVNRSFQSRLDRSSPLLAGCWALPQ